jgi:uncharacterized sulfatase
MAFLKSYWTCFFACLLSSVAVAAERPNIVMIVSDDHAWTDYGFMGHPVVQTPNIDRLANSSLTFPRGYVTSSLCCPSLATMISGRYPHQHKVTSNDPMPPEGMTAQQFRKSPLFQQGRDIMTKNLSAAGTLPNLLKQYGYRSLQTGKWWQGHYSQGGFTDGMTKGGRHGDEGLDIGRKTMEPIMSFMDACKDKKEPFFVWYAPMMPHDPHTPPDRLLNKYKDKTESLHVAKYWAMIEWFDETVGQLMQGIEERGLLDNTIILYVADNGWIQSTDNPRYAPKSKQSQYDGGLRTPIMVHWKGKVKPEMSKQLAQSIDFVPTLRQALGLPADPTLPGIDLLNPQAVQSRDMLFGTCYTHDAKDLNDPSKNVRWRWCIEGNLKLIVPNPTHEPNAVVELYDLANDPTELKNLADSQQAKVSSLQAKLDTWWTP